MAYKYTYPVVDLALRNFLMFVLMAVVTVVAAIAITFGVDVTASGLLSDDQVSSVFGAIDVGEFEDYFTSLSNQP